jgi:flagellar motor protein MotB
MKRSVGVFIGCFVLSVLMCFSAFALELTLENAKMVPSTYAKVEKDTIVFGRSATAFSPDSFNQILEAYGATLTTEGAKRAPKTYARVEKDKIVFGKGATAYDPETLNQILEAYDLTLSMEALKAGKLPKTFAQAVKDKVVFAKGATAYSPDSLHAILTAYEKPAVPVVVGIIDSDGDGVPDDIDRCPDTPRGVKVDEFGCPLDSDGDGVPDYLDKCPDTPRGVPVDQWGCPIKEDVTIILDSDGDGVPDDRDQCPDTPIGARVDERGCWILANVLFDYNKAIVKPQFYPILDEAIEVLKRNPQVRIRIQGHTCDIGGPKYNMGLSQRRANAVMKYFIQKGIAKERLSTIGFGLTKPVAPNDSEANRAKNRRVELEPIK